MFFIGDVHGYYNQYERLIKTHSNTIQVGDMGVGFKKTLSNGEVMFFANPSHKNMVKSGARFIRGNHDNPNVCKKHSQYIHDGTIEDTPLGKMMFIGGAYSIDKEYRTKDYDWWEDEELSYQELSKMIDKYLEVKPDVMVTHDCPESILAYIHSHHFGINTRTGQALDNMFSLHQPKIWVFGHHHKKFHMEIKGTRFYCCAELAVVEIKE